MGGGEEKRDSLWMVGCGVEAVFHEVPVERGGGLVVSFVFDMVEFEDCWQFRRFVT
jgi:hypothetical protein